MTEQEAKAEAWKSYRGEHGYVTMPVEPDTGADFSAGFERGALWERSRVVAAPSDTDREVLRWALRNVLTGASVQGDSERGADAVIAAGFSRSQPVQVEVTTAAELDALNLDAVVVDRAGVPRTKRAGNSHMPGGWTHGGNSPLTSTELADGNPMTVVYAGRDLLSRPAALGGGE